MRESIKDIVNRHDPLGLIAAGAPDDEYECVVGQILILCNTADSRDEAVESLTEWMVEHFGIGGDREMTTAMMLDIEASRRSV